MKYVLFLLKVLLFSLLFLFQIIFVMDFDRQAAPSIYGNVEIPKQENDVYAELIPKSNKHYFVFKSGSRDLFLKKIKPFESQNIFKIHNIAFDYVYIRVVNSTQERRIYQVVRGTNGLENKEINHEFSWFFYFFILVLKALLISFVAFGCFMLSDRMFRGTNRKMYKLNIIMSFLLGISVFSFWYIRNVI